MDKFLTHYYKIILIENGKWCFKRVGWKKKSYEQLLDDYKSALLLMGLYFVLVFLF